MAYSMGCLADMNKDYLKGRPTNWSHNVGVIDIYNNGDFNFTKSRYCKRQNNMGRKK